MSAVRVISAKIPAELYERLCHSAERNDRSMSWIIKQALDNFLADEERHRRMLEGLADVEAGRSIPHAEVQAWANQLGPKPGAAP